VFSLSALQAGGHWFDPGHVHQHLPQIESDTNLAFAPLLELGSIWAQLEAFPPFFDRYALFFPNRVQVNLPRDFRRCMA